MRTLVLPVVLGLILAGCAGLDAGSRSMVGLQDADLLERVRTELAAFESSLDATIDNAASEIDRRSANPNHRRAAVLWRTRMVPVFHDLARREPTPEGLAELWVMCWRMLDYFQSGKGMTLFGPHQSKAVGAAEDILQTFEQIPRKLTTPEAFDELRKQVRRAAQQDPIRGEFVWTGKSVWDDVALLGTIRQVVDVPLTPFSALSGIGQAPDSVRDVSASVDRFTAVAEDLPTNARWQLKLLANELAEAEVVTRTVESLARMASTAEQFNRDLAAYPEAVAAQVRAVLADAVEKLPELRDTVSGLQETVTLARSTNEEFRGTLADSGQLLEEVRAAAKALTEAAEAVRLTAQEILKFIPASMKDETGQIIGTPPDAVASGAGDNGVVADGDRDDGFSFQAVTESAIALQGTAREVLAVLVEIRAIAEEQDVVVQRVDQAGKRMDASVETAAERMKQVVDHAVSRCLQLFAVALALLLVYRLVAARFPRSGAAGQTPK